MQLCTDSLGGVSEPRNVKIVWYKKLTEVMAQEPDSPTDRKNISQKEVQAHNYVRDVTHEMQGALEFVKRIKAWELNIEPELTNILDPVVDPV